MTTTIRETNTASINVLQSHQAKVYAQEQWVSRHQDGSQVEQEVVNIYHLVKIEEDWKVDYNEVFVKSN